MKKFNWVILIILLAIPMPAEAAIFVDVTKDGYIEDFTNDQNTPLDGVPDRIADTNALLASKGELFNQFNSYRIDSHAIMAFDIAAYSGQTLASAYLTGYGTRVDTRGSTDPISGEFYIYNGDGLVGLGDFNSPAVFLGSLNFQPDPQGFNLAAFQLEVTSALQDLFDSSVAFAEFRVESEASTVFINAGETDPNGFHSIDTRWPGPKLVLNFNDSAAVVPEPATLSLLSFGLLGLARASKKNKRAGCL